MQVLQVYAKVYPYLPLSRLGLDLYKQQCYCITHLLLALSSYGALSLPKRLFQSEVKFIRDALKEMVRLSDPELVGEFVDCLLILGSAKTDPDVILGRTYLVKQVRSLPSPLSTNRSAPRVVDVHAHLAWTSRLPPMAFPHASIHLQVHDVLVESDENILIQKKHARGGASVYGS